MGDPFEMDTIRERITKLEKQVSEIELNLKRLFDVQGTVFMAKWEEGKQWKKG